MAEAGNTFSIDANTVANVEVELVHTRDSHKYYEGRPLTYFLYPALSWDVLEGFLKRHRVSQALMDKAILDLEKYHLSRL